MVFIVAMNDNEHTQAGKVLTDLVLNLFRVSSRMITSGDRLVAELGLTSARWQILGVMSNVSRPQPVSWFARDMGTSRQNLQRIIYELEKDGLVKFTPNPHHRRASLVELTQAGHDLFQAAMALQTPWVNALAQGLNVDELLTTQKVIMVLCSRLEAQN